MLTTMKVYVCYAVKIHKKFQTRGAPGAPVLDPPLTTPVSLGVIPWSKHRTDTHINYIQS